MIIHKARAGIIVISVSAILLTGCQGNGNSNNTPQTQIQGTKSKVAANNLNILNSPRANSCLTGKLTFAEPKNLWYSAITLKISNSCSTAQELTTDSTVTWISQDLKGKSVDVNTTLGLVPGWNPTLSFSTTAGEVVGHFSDKISVPAQGSINYGSNGINVNGVPYNVEIANNTLLINNSIPPVQKYGNLNIIFNAQDVTCNTTCENSAVIVYNSTSQIVSKFDFNQWGRNPTIELESLPVDQYTVSVANANNYKAVVTPAVVAIQPNLASEVNVDFTVMQLHGDLSVVIPTKQELGMPGLPDTIPVKLYNDNTIVRTYQLSLINGNNDLGELAAGNKYELIFPNLGSAKIGKYLNGGSVAVRIIPNKKNLVDYSYSTSTIATTRFSFNVTGLEKSVTANFNYKDSLNTVYAEETGINNGVYAVQFPENVNIYPTVQAPGYLSSVGKDTVYNTALVNSAEITFTPLQPSSVAGWPEYIAMGAVGGPNITPPTATSTGGDDDFGGKPVDAVFKYAGVNGNGDPGVIDPPMNALRMADDLNIVSKINKHPSRVVIVEYTGEMSGGENLADFTNSSEPNASKQNATYLMSRHFVSLAADAIALYKKPIVYNNKPYYGSLIMNPDLLGAIQQNNYLSQVNAQLPVDAVNKAVDQALCLLTTSRNYTNRYGPNGYNGQVYLNKTYSGTPVEILINMLSDGYPAWSISARNDEYWGTMIDNKIEGTKKYSQVGAWFNECIQKPEYDTTKYKRPEFPSGFDGWVQANNWLIRTFAPKGTVTFGWQENLWATGSGWWVHNDLSLNQIADQYSNHIINYLSASAPSTVTVGSLGIDYIPDFFVFDRYEMDDSRAADQAALYSARSWDNVINAAGQISRAFNNIPIMLWQIPGAHLPYIGEVAPQFFDNTKSSYVFSTAPVYFFGDSNLNADLSNLITGSEGASANIAVGNFRMPGSYNCPLSGCNYKQYLRYYNHRSQNYDWSKDNAKLALAAQNNIFAILWGGGQTTSVIKNFMNPDDHGYLANKIIKYYQNPTPLLTH